MCVTRVVCNTWDGCAVCSVCVTYCVCVAHGPCVNVRVCMLQSSTVRLALGTCLGLRLSLGRASSTGLSPEPPAVCHVQ